MTVISDDLDELDGSLTTEPERGKAKRKWLRWTPLALLVLLLGALTWNLFTPVPVLSGKAGSQLSAQAEARKDICQFAPTLATYDFKNLKPYFDGVLAHATGDFKAQFTKGQGELSDWLKQGQVTSKATGVSCGVDATGSNIHVVIGITQSIGSIATQGRGVETTLSVVASVQKIGDKWMITKLDGPLLAK